MNNWSFCPRCGTRLPENTPPRPPCPACGFVHYADPKVTVCVLLLRNSEVLLGKREMEPGKGKWCLPGGFMDYGEEMRAAAAREVREETGLEVEVGDLLQATDWDDPLTGKKGIALHFAARVLAGEPRAADDLVELAWYPVDALPEMAFPSDGLAIAALRAKRSIGESGI